MLWRLIKGLLTLVGVLALVAVGLIYWQLRSLEKAMEAEAPLALPEVEQPARPARRALVEQVMAEAQAPEHVIHLSGESLTWMLSAVLQRPEVRRAMLVGGAHVSAQLGQVPVGDFDHLKMENLDLDALKAQILVEGSQIILKATAPYRHAPVHLNLLLAATGGWSSAQGAAPGQVQPTSLKIGDRDLLDSALYGDQLKDAIQHAIDEALASIPPHQSAASPIEQVQVQGGEVLITVKPGQSRRLGLMLNQLL